MKVLFIIQKYILLKFCRLKARANWTYATLLDYIFFFHNLYKKELNKQWISSSSGK